jgi:hypothetical protein
MNKITHKALQFGNCDITTIVQEKETPLCYVRAPLRVVHGDPKALTSEFRGLEAGEAAILVKVWLNFHGWWCRVRRTNGQFVDVRDTDLNWIPKEEYENEQKKTSGV